MTQAKCSELGEEARELASWFGNSKFPTYKADPHKTALELQELNWPLELIVTYISTKPKAPRGRAYSNRLVIVNALEYMEQHPKATWQMLTNQFCQCGASNHGEKCKQLIRTRVNGLKKTINKKTKRILIKPSRFYCPVD